MNQQERQELERVRQFHIQRYNETAAEETRYELSRVYCGACSRDECWAPDCPHSKHVDPVIPE